MTNYRCPFCAAVSTRPELRATNIRCDNCGRFYYAPDNQLPDDAKIITRRSGIKVVESTNT